VSPSPRSDGRGTVDIETTRPEMLASCVALVAHPDDERYRPLFGTVVTPLFGVEVPILAHELADPEKGSGIAMICTFGDTTDVTWWRELNLPTRALIGRDGRFLPADFSAEELAVRDADAQELLRREVLEGRTVNQARATIVDALRATGELIGDTREITHPVKFYEKGERPLEIVTSRQWFVRTLEHRDELFARGEEFHWHPTSCAPLPLVGRRAQRRLEHLAPAFLRRALSRRGTPSTRAARLTSITP
jgi:valyl-tRNA synthetase